MNRQSNGRPGLSRNWRRFIRTVSDYELFKINPFTFADQLKLQEEEVLELLLRSTKTGIFSMDWGIVCPTCGSDIGSFRSLKNIENHFFCNICQVDSKACLDDHIMVTFTINPKIRKISYHEPDSLSIEDYALRYRFSREGKIPGTQKRFPDYLGQFVKDMFDLNPKEKKEIALNANEGYVLVFDLHSEGGLCITVNPKGKSAPPDLTFSLEEGKYLYSEEHTYAPGNLAFTLDNQCNEKSRILVFFEPRSKS